MNKYSNMPKDELALELEKLQDHYEYFQRADGNYRDPVEARMRRKNEHDLKLIHTEINRRKPLTKTNEEKRHGSKESK